MTIKLIPREFSDDAKVVLGSIFGMGTMTALNFKMRESKPTTRTQAALDELVAEGALNVERGKDGSLSYKPTLCPEELRPYLSWMRKNSKRKDLRWPITEPLSAVQIPALGEDDDE